MSQTSLRAEESAPRESQDTRRPKRFTVEEYHRMVESGVLDEGSKVELIEGELFPMAAMGSRHAACIDRLNKLLNAGVPAGVIVRVQCPVSLPDDSEPEPDLALLRPNEDFYASSHPGPEDVLLVIEVSDTTYDFDTKVKLPNYARAGIREVWIVDPGRKTVETHTAPATGEYRERRISHPGESFSSEAVPQEIQTSGILG